MTSIQSSVLNGKNGEGEALFIGDHFSPYGTIDTATGMIIDGCAKGKSIRDKVLIFRSEAGSTVAPWIFLSLQTTNNLPKAIICQTQLKILLPVCFLCDLPGYDLIDAKSFELLKEENLLICFDQKGTLTLSHGITQN